MKNVLCGWNTQCFQCSTYKSFCSVMDKGQLKSSITVKCLFSSSNSLIMTKSFYALIYTGVINLSFQRQGLGKLFFFPKHFLNTLCI